MRESLSNHVTIEDLDAASFKQLLRYVYSGRLPDDLERSPEIFLPAAEKYDMQELKTACLAAMIKNVRVENVVEYVVMAHLFQCPDLKSECLQRLKKWKKCLPHDAFKLLKSHPDLLIEIFRES